MRRWRLIGGGSSERRRVQRGSRFASRGLALTIILPVAIAAAASCQAILGIEEGKERVGPGGTGGPGGGDAGTVGGAGEGGGTSRCIDMTGSENVNWSMTIGGEGNDDVRAVAVGHDGTLAVVGHFDSLQLFIGAGDDGLLPGSGDSFVSGYVAKLDGAPSVLWARRLSSDEAHVAMTGIVYARDAVVVVGNFAKPLRVVGQDGDAVVNVSYPNVDVPYAGFVLRMDDDTNADDARTIAGSSSFDISAVTTSAGGDVYVAGRFEGVLYLDSEPQNTPSAIASAFVVRYSQSLELVGSAVFQSTTAVAISAATVEPDGSGVLVGGSFEGELTSSSPGGLSLSSPGKISGWLARVTIDIGTVSVAHAHQLPDPSAPPGNPQAGVNALASDGTEGAVASVCFEGDVTIAGESVEAISSGRECVVGQVAVDKTEWFSTLPRPANAAPGLTMFSVGAVSAAAPGWVAFGGAYAGAALEFGADKVMPAPTPPERSDAFLVLLDPSSSYALGLAIRDSGASFIASIGMDPCGTTVAAGLLHALASEEIVDVEGPGGVENPVLVLSAHGGHDGFLLALRGSGP